MRAPQYRRVYSLPVGRLRVAVGKDANQAEHDATGGRGEQRRPPEPIPGQPPDDERQDEAKNAVEERKGALRHQP